MSKTISKIFGIRKCEANALVVIPKEAQQLCRDAIEDYLKPDAEQRFKKIENETMENLIQHCKKTFNEVFDKEKLI